jgi:hypothetical protein
MEFNLRACDYRFDSVDLVWPKCLLDLAERTYYIKTRYRCVTVVYNLNNQNIVDAHIVVYILSSTCNLSRSRFA